MMTFPATDQPVGSETYVLSTWLFLRLLGLIYFFAFVSLGVQVRGLIGKRGIWPVGCDFPATANYAKWKLYFRRPTLCLWNTSDRFVIGLCVTGAVLSLLLVAGIAPVPALFLLWLIYLSLTQVCGVFLGFQWDILLLETGFVTIFLAPLEWLPSFPPAHAPPDAARWLLLWLLFRLIFSSGVVKIRSGDKTWRDLTAMCFHYETQPLPNRLSWYAHQLPRGFQRTSTAIMFFIELLVPFGLFAPEPVCTIAAGLIVLLMVLIFCTGNYCFFNGLALALCVLILSDGMMGYSQETLSVAIAAPVAWQIAAVCIGAVLLALSVDVMARLFRRPIPWPGFITKILVFLQPLRLVNGYGLFAVMTASRPEIIVEGSMDGQTWKNYEFKWKVGDPKRIPRHVAPHQPRLDWQMWFAALGGYRNNPWFIQFLTRLLEGSPEVLALLKTNPFPDAPPKFVQAWVYDYRFTDFKQRRETGHWWRLEYKGQYCPPLVRNASTGKVEAYPYYLPRNM